MINKKRLMAFLMICAVLISGCENNVGKPKETTPPIVSEKITYAETPTPIPRVYPLPQTSTSNSKEMQKIISLSKKYLNKNLFEEASYNYAVENPLITMYEGGKTLNYEQFVDFFNNIETGYPNLQEYTKEDYLNYLDEQNLIKECTYLKYVDIDNDGSDEIVFAWFDFGAKNFAYTNIYKQNEDGKFENWFDIMYETIYRILEVDGKFYLATYKVDDESSTFDSGFQIAYIDKNTIEIVTVSELETNWLTFDEFQTQHRGM